MLRRFFCWLGFHNWYGAEYLDITKYDKQGDPLYATRHLWCSDCNKQVKKVIDAKIPESKFKIIKGGKDNG